MALGKLSKAHAVGEYANEIGKVSLTVELTLHRWAYGKMQGCSTPSKWMAPPEEVVVANGGFASEREAQSFHTAMNIALSESSHEKANT